MVFIVLALPKSQNLCLKATLTCVSGHSTCTKDQICSLHFSCHSIVALCHTWSSSAVLSPTKSQHHPLPKMLRQGEDYTKGDGKCGGKTWTLRIKLNTAGHSQAIPPNLHCPLGPSLIFCEVSPSSINHLTR